MAGIFFVPYKADDELIPFADGFLKTYNKASLIPVPIEEIVELDLGITIMPIKDLKSIYGVDSYITSDFKHIVIDEYKYDNFEERTRFTYAHEVTHLLLHKNVYEAADIKDESEYLDFQKSLDAQTNKRLEIQAHIVASYILLPRDIFRNFVDGFISRIGTRSLTSTDLADLINAITDRFFVSEYCAVKHINLEYPNLMKKVSTDIPF